jgi:hypothetical protein
MFNQIAQIIVAVSIFIIVFFAYLEKDRLPKLVSYTILASIAITMALNGLAGLISGVDFLNFLESIFRTMADFVVFLEIGLIIFLMFFSKHKTKITLLKVFIIIYIIFTLILRFGLFN